MREKLEAANCQKEMLQEELTTLCKRAKKAGADIIQEFKASQSFIDSCANYYDTGFEDCLKQVESTFPDLDLSRITMDAAMPTTPASDTVIGDNDDSTKPDLPPKDDGVVLA